jgi:hypothetical protein
VRFAALSDALQIEAILRKVEPAVRLVPVRHLRKLLHFLRDHGRMEPANPDLPLWASRGELAVADVVTAAVLSGSEDPLLLVTTPDDRSLDALPRDQQLREYWRLVHRAAIQAAIRLPDFESESRLSRLGAAAAREIRYVLESEHWLDPEAGSAELYRAFAGAYLDLQSFFPEAVSEFFPSLPPAPEVLAVLGADVDAAGLLSRTRPAGSAEARLPAVHDEPHSTRELLPARMSDALVARALEAEQKGNYVRAAILRTRAASAASEESRELLESSTRMAVGKLVHELAGVLGWNDTTQREWRHAIVPLLAPAAAGKWPRAARCLYELQKIPSDLAREVFAVDLVEPIRTLGRRPVKRPLPHALDVRLLLKIRAAHKQLLKSGLSESAHEPLDELFHRELHRVEEDIRRTLAPIIGAALTESGFHPANRIEEVARDKVVGELLDRICERGYLRFGDLRDAVARNQLKMPDLAGPGEFVAGDPLLRSDTRLAYDLDGIYRRGEFYLRGLQRGSSLFFGTRWGRWIFLYLIAPFLAAFLTLTFAIELKHIGGKAYAFASKILAPKRSPAPITTYHSVEEGVVYYWDEDDHLVWVDKYELEWDDDGQLVWIDHEPAYDWDDEGNLISFDPDELANVFQVAATSSATPPAEGEHHESPLPDWEPVFVFGVFLLLVFYVPPFRRALLSVLIGLLRTLRAILWDIPAQAIRSPVFVAIRYSAPVRFLSRYLSAPILVTACVVAFLAFLGASPSRLMRWGGVVFGAALLACNTPWGWGIQERLSESVSDGWRIVRVNLLPGLVATVIDWFRRLANWIERQLYEVDEWLRYRGGDSGGSLALKALLGLFWFPFAYMARFAFYLLIEPQINPVKHFPVVTVSHKVILPLAPQLAEALGVTKLTALWLLAGVPGIFGFIAWELLANWRLYAANRPARLKPVVLGSHGESMRGLLRPGFHSGAVPKIFRKIRRAEEQGKRPAALRLHHDLHHAAEGVHRFIDRQLLALLKKCPESESLRLSIAEVRFGCQRAVIHLAAPELGADQLVLAFENRGGRVAADIDQSGWLDKLTAPQRGALLAALRGLLDMAAAELYRDRERLLEDSASPRDELLQPYLWNEWVKRWERNHFSST